MRIFRYSLTAMALVGAFTLQADTRVSGGTIHTMDPANPNPEAICVGDDGRIKALSDCDNESQLDLAGGTLIPGFIEGHGHLMSLGFSKLNLDLSQTKSLDQLVANVAEAVDEAEPGEWIVGRGWHQSKWTSKPKMVKGFQTNETLNEVSPDLSLIHI